VDPVLELGQRRPPVPRADPLGLAVALYVEGGMTEVEALRALHARVLGRAVALDIRLDGEIE